MSFRIKDAIEKLFLAPLQSQAPCHPLLKRQVTEISENNYLAPSALTEVEHNNADSLCSSVYNTDNRFATLCALCRSTAVICLQSSWAALLFSIRRLHLSLMV
jgi:hypothetical protein